MQPTAGEGADCMLAWLYASHAHPACPAFSHSVNCLALHARMKGNHVKPELCTSMAAMCPQGLVPLLLED